MNTEALCYRRMRVDDLSDVFAVRFSTRENAITPEELETDYGITPDSLAEAMTSQVAGWLCADGDKVVGFAMGDRSNGEVQVVAVLPDYEGQGIGKTLLSHVRDWLFANGHSAIWLLANPDPKVRATGFYRRLGWRRTGTMRGGDEVLTLRKAPADR